MGTVNNSGFRTFKAAAAITEGQRVHLSAAETVTVSGASDASIGVAVEAAPANGYVTVKLFDAQGTWFCQAAGAITVGTQLYPAASGRVAATGTTALPMVALEAATAAGDIIECAMCMKGA